MKNKYWTSVGQLNAEEYLLLFAPVYEKLVQSQEPVVLYGSGPLTELLFARYDIEKLNFIGISDGNPLKWDQTFLNKKIIPPREINTFEKAAVLIISGSSQPEIKYRLEKLLKPGISLIPGLQYSYYNAIGQEQYTQNHLPYWEEQRQQWEKPLIKNNQILCLVEGDTLEPFILHLMTSFKKKMTVLALSPYIYNGLKERGFNMVNLQAQRKEFKQEFSKTHDTVESEGEMIKSVNQSSLSSSLTFNRTKDKVFDAIFYDRLIFQLLQNTGLEEFTARWITKTNWDTCWYTGPFQDTVPASFLIQCRRRKIPAYLFYTGAETNYLSQDILQNLGTTVHQPNPFKKECEKRRQEEITQELKMVPFQRSNFSQNITLIPFILSRRWETRELVKQILAQTPYSGNTDELILIKCLEKVRHFNGMIGEADFCREYMANIIENDKRVIVIDHLLTDSEAVQLAHRILAVEPCRITSIADNFNKNYEIAV